MEETVAVSVPSPVSPWHEGVARELRFLERRSGPSDAAACRRGLAPIPGAQFTTRVPLSEVNLAGGWRRHVQP